MPLPKIPDDIYENRCRYCFHFCKEGENRDFKDNEVYSYQIKHSCDILGVARYFYQVRHDNGTFWGEVENIAYSDGECRSFSPMLSYPGICNSCRYHNPFVKGYCTIEKGKDYRIAFIANDHGSESYGSGYYTCSNWKMSENAKYYYLKDIVAEKVPPIIDTKTFKLIADPCKLTEAVKEWAEIRDKQLAEIEASKPPKEEYFRQLSLFD